MRRSGIPSESERRHPSAAVMIRTRESRRKRYPPVTHALPSGDCGGVETARDWDRVYETECFYNAIRILFEPRPSGRSVR